jgi:butyrate kinase
MEGLILVVNTGNTSTKIGIYRGEEPEFVETIRHSDEELAEYKDINDQKDFREKLILDFLKEKGIAVNDLAAVSARGGLLRPLESGTYLVNSTMITDLIEGKRGMHASHLSAQIGYSIAQKAGIQCFTVDPVSVDEFEPVARFSGHKLFERVMMTHALNMKAVAKRYARENKVKYSDLSLIVIHLGTGISISLHKGGRMVDVMNPTEEGAFSLDRSGGLPILQVAKYITDNRLTYKEFSRTVFGNGGLYSYLNTKEFLKVLERYNDGDTEAIGVVHAMAYQIAKEVGALGAVACGHVDQILFTGGMAQSELLVKLIGDRIKFIAPISLYPGEDEIRALAEGVCRVMDGEETAREY